MRLKLSRSGGFAGIQPPPITVDTADLPPAQAKRCEQLLSDPARFDLPPRPPGPGRPDRFEYTLEILPPQGAAQRVTIGEADAPAALMELVRLIQQIARSRKKAEPDV